MQTGPQNHRTPDMIYSLNSLIYHCLKSARMSEKSKIDAELLGEKELAAFFQEIALADRQRAERAKSFLAKELRSYAPRDSVEQASKASFPASDPPSYSPGLSD